MRVEERDMEVGGRSSWLQYDEFIPTADSTIKSIAAADSKIEFIAAGGR